MGYITHIQMLADRNSRDKTRAEARKMAKAAHGPWPRAAQLAEQGYGVEDIMVKCSLAPDARDWVRKMVIGE